MNAYEEAKQRLARGEDPFGLCHAIDGDPERGLSTAITHAEWKDGGYTADYDTLIHWAHGQDLPTAVDGPTWPWEIGSVTLGVHEWPRCGISFDRYNKGDNIALQLYCYEAPYGWDPLATATVWVGGLDPDELAIKDYSENKGMLAVLGARHNIVRHPHRFVMSGWVVMPVVRLTPKGQAILEAQRGDE